MRLAEKHRAPLEAHFTEGELDLEPPEEMAIGELDDEAILEEELDNEDLLEQDVDEDTLEASLEVLVHGADDDDDDDDDGTVDGVYVATGLAAVGDADSEDPDEGFGTEDHEESLDLVLLDRLALVDDGATDAEDDDVPSVMQSLLLQLQTDTADLVEVTPRRADEFVCPSCFLVRKRVQLVDSATMACHDCSI
jgi:Domain of unknown function (DUF4193)